MDPYFVTQIARIRRALYREFETRVASSGLTVPQCQVLIRLSEEEGMLTSTLVRETGSDGATVSGIIDRLEARGLIRRERGAADRRRVYLFLTPAGREAERPLRSIMWDLNEEMLVGLSPVQQGQLRTLLARVEQNLTCADGMLRKPESAVTGGAAG